MAYPSRVDIESCDHRWIKEGTEEVWCSMIHWIRREAYTCSQCNALGFKVVEERWDDILGPKRAQEIHDGCSFRPSDEVKPCLINHSHSE